jgi:hypothetical protein
MRVSFVTPAAGLVALVGLVPLLVLVIGRSRLQALCARLGLAPPGRRSLALSALAFLLLSVLLGLAAAQPVVATRSTLEGRNDAAVFVVFDVSRSMAARTATSPTRLDRARADAKEMRADLPGLPVGVASLTDRLLPHLFPSVSVNTFDATVDESLAIDRPTSSLPYGNALGTSIGALKDLVIGRYFEARAKRRVAVVFTDGETLPNDLSTLPYFMRSGGVKVLFVRYWRPTERLYDEQGRLDPAYVPDPDLEATFDAAARTLSARVFDAGQAPQAAAAVRALAGDGPLTARQRELDSRLLTPYVLLVAFVPLAFLLARRDARKWSARLRGRGADAPAPAPAEAQPSDGSSETAFA